MKIIKYIIEAIFVYFIFFLIKIVGLNFGRKISSYFFLNIGILFRSKKLIKQNIINALGNIPESKIENIMTSMWKNYGSIFSEYIYLKKFRLNKFLNPHIHVHGREILDEVIKAKKPVVFVSGHFANFELMAMELEKYNINLAAIYRPLNNTFLNVIMERIRKKHICQNQIKKGRSGTRELLNFFKNGFSIALMIDQRVSEGIKSDFFGHPALTTTIPAQLVKKFECSVVPVYIERVNETSFRLKINKPIIYEKNASIEEITKDLNKWLEKMILNNPSQWIWSHNRWK